MLKPTTFFSVLAAALSALAGPALAANQTVQTVDIAFMPSDVAVKPGETVTWNHPATSELHNVRFDDLTYPNPPIVPVRRDPWTTARTFTTEGAYRYFCEEHGSPGGVGMSGIVYVTASGELPAGAPVARLAEPPSSPRTGENVTFNAGGSTDVGGSIVKYEWDLDGDGSYETDTGTFADVAQAYQAAGPRTVKVRVTDNQGLTGEDARSFTVISAPPPPPPPPPPFISPVTPPVTGGQATSPVPLPAVSSKIRVLSSKRLKKVLRNGLRFEAGVPSNGATLRATLSLRGRTLGSLRRTNLSRGRVKLTIKLSRRGKATLRKALAKRKRTSALMKVTAGTATSRARVTLSR